ncbi:MAG: 3-deoxy-D-manno-octulosonic acid transferase [Syntrophobacteraceae bacterium]|jgi:3-deoxy-D-manno-octulosonic-acid transferase
MKFCGRAAWAAYEAVLCSSWPALYLYYFCRSRTDGKYGANYLSRMGLKLPRLQRPGTKRVWVHALSVGEVLSSIPLIAQLKRLRPDFEIVFSTSTETGMSIAAERLRDLADGFFFMPHDFPWTVDRLLERVDPSLFVLIETDFWPNLIWRLKRRGVPAALVNGRLSPGSYRGYSRLGGFTEVMFGGFELIFAQTELDRSRFISMGGLADRVIAAGNLKFESTMPRVSESESVSIRAGIGLEAGRPVWVAGSTHDGEERIVLGIHRRLAALVPELLLVIAPRKIQRGLEIAALADGLGLDCAVRSRGEKAAGKAVYVLDTLGELSKTYAICDIAFLGGSFAEIGGHNPLEAVAQGRPACWGPHFFNFSEIERELLEAGCAMKVFSERELEDFLQKTLLDPARIAKMAEAAESFAGSQRHAASRIASILLATVG